MSERITMEEENNNGEIVVEEGGEMVTLLVPEDSKVEDSSRTRMGVEEEDQIAFVLNQLIDAVEAMERVQEEGEEVNGIPQMMPTIENSSVEIIVGIEIEHLPQQEELPKDDELDEEDAGLPPPSREELEEDRPKSLVDVAVGCSQPMMEKDEEKSFQTVAVGDSQPLFDLIDVGVGLSQPQERDKQEMQTSTSSHIENDGINNTMEGEVESQTVENEILSEDHENNSPPNIYMSIEDDDIENYPPRRLQESPSGARPPLTPSPGPPKRRRILGELPVQQVPNSSVAVNILPVMMDTSSIKQAGVVPSVADNGCITSGDDRCDSALRTVPESSLSKLNHTAFPVNPSPSNVHTAIRVDPPARNRLRVGLSRSAAVPPLHPGLRRKHPPNT